MQIVNELVISKSVKHSNDKSKNGKRVHRKGKRSEEEQRLIESLIRENNDIYKDAKQRGKSTLEERLRCQEIRLELIRMKAI